MFTCIRTLKFVFVNGSSHKNLPYGFAKRWYLRLDVFNWEILKKCLVLIQYFPTLKYLSLKKKISIFSYLKERDPLHIWKVLGLFCRVKYETLCLVCSVLINSLRWQIDYFWACLGMNKGKVICVNFNVQKNKISQCPVVPSHSSFLI